MTPAMKKLATAAAEAYAAFMLVARAMMFPTAVVIGFFAAVKFLVVLFPSIGWLVPSFLNRAVGMEMIAAGILFALIARG